MDTKIKKLLDYFSKISEEAFTLEVIKPLFEFLGYYRVDYHGGRDEGGKDLICFKDDEFDNVQLTVIQVKKVKASAAASSSNSFAGLVNQLQQAGEKEVPSLDGLKRRPNFVYFITPYEIDVRALTSRFEQQSHLNVQGLKVLDGCTVAKQLVSKMPNLVRQIIGDEITNDTVLPLGLSNNPLLNALNYRANKDYKAFFVNLDFGIGQITNTIFVESIFDGINKEISFQDEWLYKRFFKKINLLEQALDDRFIQPSQHEIEINYSIQKSLYDSKENAAKIKEFNKKIQSLTSLLNGLHFSLNEVIEIFRAKQEKIEDGDLLVDEEKLHEVKRLLNKLEFLYQAESFSDFTGEINSLFSEAAKKLLSEVQKFISVNSNIFESAPKPDLDKYKRVILKSASKKSKSEYELLKQLIESMLNSFNSFGKIFEAINNAKLAIASEPHYLLTINGEQIANKLKLKQDCLKTELNSYDSTSNKSNLKQILIDYSKLFRALEECQDELVAIEILTKKQKSSQFDSIDDVRNSVSLSDMFDTGIDMAIVGDAGAGKSTTLEMYARTKLEQNDSNNLLLFLPLTKVIKEDGVNPLEPLLALESGIVSYVNDLFNIVWDVKKLSSEILKYKRTQFIFDGVDEVIKSAPWIIDAINTLKNKHSNAQIIMSSRLGGNYLSEIKFLTVTILPFTRSQLFQFFSGWFSNNSTKIKLINDHLTQNLSVAEIVRNPLLATILCTLAESGVPLPTKEVNLYKERIKLLLGHYDIHKQSRRLASHHDTLEDCARKIAYKLHRRNSRMATIQELIDIATNALKQKYTNEQVKLAVEELIQSCNILTIMSSQEEYGFGHLRFQEHLVAEELIRDRGIELTPFLKSAWWRSVMVLFSQMTDSFQSILEAQIEHTGGIGVSAQTLEAMLAVRSSAEQMACRSLLKRFKSLDKDSLFFD